MAQHEAQDLTQAVIDRLADCTDPRFKQLMSALVRHAHAFVREVELSEAEWIAAIGFLTETGKTCDDKRQEFILLSDTLGISMLVVAINQLKAARAFQAAGGGASAPTEATVQGPFYWEGAPELELGSDIGEQMPGEPAYYHGTVTDTTGKPIANCCLDVWSGDGEGVYDMQMGDDAGMRLRARFHTDAQGRYRFWSIKPSFYPVPDDGPVGEMLRRMGRHPNRPGHIHMKVYAPGHQPVTTHLFVADSPYLDSDAVFGVRNSLIVPFSAHAPGTAPDGRHMNIPYHSASYDFRLVPAA
ncbi:MAG: intradiol ring-cleavage dioxygenase [Hydrogenophaga sp.]|jgi:hydroxyquinol 1,2-dioxygenase|uniref:intradiol ring-cleavage dioxygenase n=1 Tax=Hydrogenophaga sp. TaxID=1904254 RepID=UPI002768F106|nr:intradiol ring-cleavage dioxygenase [Hydrogenophaga sp.]